MEHECTTCRHGKNPYDTNCVQCIGDENYSQWQAKELELKYVNGFLMLHYDDELLPEQMSVEVISEPDSVTKCRVTFTCDPRIPGGVKLAGD